MSVENFSTSIWTRFFCAFDHWGVNKRTMDFNLEKVGD